MDDTATKNRMSMILMGGDAAFQKEVLGIDEKVRLHIILFFFCLVIIV